ncbi:hypothetical protein FKP32DRAFT_1541892, partial [Trametes sanguinea]
GGPRLLYALSHAFGLPSVSTLQRHMPIPRLLPCISKPTEKEISANVNALCDPLRKPPMLARRPTVAPLVLMVDGIAIEERCRYSAEHNSIIGLCREHSQGIPTRVTSFDVIQEVERALHGPHSNGTPICHYGKDATVAAVAPCARVDHYTPVPILVSSSCKAEGAEGVVETVSTILDVWRTRKY